MIDPSKPRSLGEKIRHRLFGAPIATSQAHNERLGPLVGLAVFSSDSLSSVAYATEAILAVLILFATQGNLAPLGWQWPISLAIVGLIVIISISYTQTIHAYPTGGGSYIVASENLGYQPYGLVAGAALLIDYILTVAVSVAAGVAALLSAFPVLHGHLIDLSILFIAIIAWANLRGVRESGAVFAVPTYGFVVAMIAMLGAGGYRVLTGSGVEFPKIVASPETFGSEANYAAWFIVLRAFAAGCTALTGIEAVSNGVQAFRPPEAKNAALTLRNMAILLAVMFLGMGWIALHLPTVNLLPAHDPASRTVSSQVAAFAFGLNSPGFYGVQIATMLILVLAANTAYADFPRLASLIARDGYLPRSLARQGDRLVFHNGIIVLSVAAVGLVVYFQGALEHLLPLYAVGVFTAFTLSQAGMVVHWRRHHSKGWQRSLVVNFVGAVLSLAVLIIIAYTKFSEGAWLVLVLIPMIYGSFVWVKNRYTYVNKQLEVTSATETSGGPSTHTALLLVPRVHQGILAALKYAKLTGLDHATGVHVSINEKSLQETKRMWDRFAGDVPLVVLSTPYRSLIRPVLDYVDELMEENPNQMITVIVAEGVAKNVLHKLLQENVAQQLKRALGARKNVVVANVRYFLD